MQLGGENLTIFSEKILCLKRSFPRKKLEVFFFQIILKIETILILYKKIQSLSSNLDKSLIEYIKDLLSGLDETARKRNSSLSQEVLVRMIYISLIFL